MKRTTPSLLFAALLASVPDASAPSLFASDSAAPAHPPVTIAQSELRVLPPTAAGRHYELQIHLPASYDAAPARRYPVIYVTDGYWDFPTVQVSVDNLVYDRVVPEIIIVGLGYAGDQPAYGSLRRWELSPAPLDNDPVNTGHAADFLGTLEHEIIPFVEREYRADPAHRYLAGSSLGGLFALYTLYTRPELFQGYIAASPAVRVDDDWLLGYEEHFAKSGRPLPARLYLTGAENEWPDFLAAIKRFEAQLATRHYPGFTHEFRLVDGMRHAGTKAESYARGLIYLFAPLAPETGVMQDHPY